MNKKKKEWEKTKKTSYEWFKVNTKCYSKRNKAEKISLVLANNT